MKINQIGLSRLAAEKIQQTEVLMKTRSFLLAAGVLLALAFTFSCDSGGGGGDGTGGGSSSSGGSQSGVSSSSGGGNPGGNVSRCPVSAVSNNSVTCGGQTYKTVQIGSQKWFAENLNYDPGTGNSVCYDNQASNCATYGRLYDWETAMGVCPSGWHLPSDDEWQTLVDFAGGDDVAGEKLKATSGWNNKSDGSSGNGTDQYGFSALPGGYGYWWDVNSHGVGNGGYWWSATEGASDRADNRTMNYNNSRVVGLYDYKSTLNSVRCVQD